MRHFLSFVLGVLLLLALAGSAYAYLDGIEGFTIAEKPKQGFSILGYSQWYHFNKAADNDGDKVTMGPSTNLRGDILTGPTRIVYMSDHKLLGATWGADVYVTTVYAKLRSDFGNPTMSAFGDVIVDPLLLYWSPRNVKINTGLNFLIPTPDGLGYHAYGVEPFVGLAFATSVEGLTARAKLAYDFLGTNDAGMSPFTGATGDFEYGQELHLEGALDYAFNDNFRAGVSGYAFQQTTDSEFEGQEIHDMKGRVFALGPGVRYVTDSRKFALEFRTLFEMGARNKTQGISNWISIYISF